MRFQHLNRWALTAQDALVASATRASMLTTRWDVAGNCQSPVYREYSGAERIGGSIEGTSSRRRGPQMVIEFTVRCRQCDNCLRARAAHWRLKAYAELRRAPRTWFGTLTFAPDRVYRARCAAEVLAVKRGHKWEELSADAQFRYLADELGKECTKYWKRLRKAGAQFRYCLVAEAHKSGVPHYHALVHELSDDAPVRHKMLADKWDAGFSKWKLAEGPRVAHYVTKYLTKSMRARIRASRDYGVEDTALAIAEGVKRPEGLLTP